MATNILAPSSSLVSGKSDIDLARKIRYGNATEDYAVYNTAKQQYESAKTGQPWHGKVIGGYAVRGKFSSTPSGDMPAEPGAAPNQFTVTKTVRQPEIATATGNLLKTQQQQASQTGTNFNDFLKQAREINAQSREQLTKDQAAFDTSKIEASLPANDAAYRTEQERITGEIAGRNKDYASQTQDVLNRLTQENKAYEANAQAVADRAFQNAMKRNSLYQLTSGTPTSGSGALTNRYLKSYADINIPLQRELSARRYSQIADIERPYQRELYGNDQNVFARESALASDYANRTEGTDKYLQNLRMQVAGMSRQQAQNYLLNLGLPIELSQKIIAGDIANLGGIQRLDELANFYTVQTPFDASRLPQVQSFPITSPGRSYTPGSGVPMAPDLSTPGAPPAVAGIDSQGNPRTNPLGPDYTPWYTAPLVAGRNIAPPRLAPATYRPDNEYFGYPMGSSFAPGSGAYSIQ